MDGGQYAGKNWRRTAGGETTGRLFGPAGVGQAGNFRQMITVLGVLAGAGIFNGVTKLVAQHHDNPAQLRTVVGTSSAMVLGFSTLLALVFLLAAAPISQWTVRSYGLSRAGASGCAGTNGDRPANLLLALMKGFRDASGNALSLIVGSFGRCRPVSLLPCRRL